MTGEASRKDSTSATGIAFDGMELLLRADFEALEATLDQLFSSLLYTVVST